MMRVDAIKLAEFCQRWKIAEVALFGSATRDDFNEKSDVDVLVSFFPDARPEIGSRFKAYFWDMGIRNIIINRFEPIEGRADRGALLENLIISGIARRNLYSGRPYRHYYWQSYAGYEVDCVLDAVEKKELVALEIKYQGKGRITRAFDKYHPDRTIIAGFHDSYRYCL